MVTVIESSVTDAKRQNRGRMSALSLLSEECDLFRRSISHFGSY